MNLYQQLLAAVAQAPTQTERLLVLHTPLGKDVLLAERAQIDEAIIPAPHAQAMCGCRVVVHALAADSHIELKALIGQPALLELLTARSRSDLRPFHGHISEAALLGSDAGLARYRLVIEPWLSFLAHRCDSHVFQRKSVVQIIEEVFADYAVQGKLAPMWRWDLADAGVYAERSLCIQYQESDLDFVLRLLREEGLFGWIEHRGEAGNNAGNSGDASLGQHTLVIADHNGAFKPAAQPRVRFTQVREVLQQDSLSRWTRQASVHTASIELASLDYRSRSLRPQSQAADPTSGATPFSELSVSDVPGAYAYEDAAQGQRLALRQMQAADARRDQAQAVGTVRDSAPATTFTLSDHPLHDGSDDSRDRFVTLAVRHRVRSNLRADQQAQVLSLLGKIDAVNAQSHAGHAAHHIEGEPPESTRPDSSTEPVYGCHSVVQRAAVPVRMAGCDALGLPDVRLHPRPTVQGVQTAIVVGLGDPVHTDRDHRIKIQFHWQRGSNASHRLAHPGGGKAEDNAPASDASGTWVRVAQSVAGANWGAVFTPRLGQEVLVQFVAGDIDRPVVVGVVYNGLGNTDAQGNQAGAGAATATGDAAAWFPGARKQGGLQGHQHAAVMSGYKSQQLSASQSGAGGYNQLVFDDSAGANRIELSSTSAQTRLQLGHLLNQNDNQRLQPRGHGLDLASAAWGAVRAGQGLLVSAHGKPGSQSGGRSLDSREPQAQLEQSQLLLHTLAESAQQHNAKGAQEPNVIGATRKDTARQLPNEQAAYASLDSLAATQQSGGGANGEAASGADSGGQSAGGTGTVTAWTRPDLVLAAPGGIGSFTPAHAIFSAGATATLAAGQDIQQLAQRHVAAAAKSGLVFYTYGKAQNANKPNTETGIALHAASGNVNTQSLSAATKLTADKLVDVSSTTAMVRVAAPKHVLLTAAGAALHIEAGNITLKGPGRIEFKASAKELTGGAAASNPALYLPRPDDWTNWIALHHRDSEGEPMAVQRYSIFFAGNTIIKGTLDAEGKARHEVVPQRAERVEYEPRKPLPEEPWSPLDKLTQAADELFGKTT